MKKVIVLIALFVGLVSVNAQTKFGAKAGVNYNNFGDAKAVGQDILDTKADGKSGYHVGVWAKAQVPILGVYIRPEFVYTQLKTNYGRESLKIKAVV